VKIQELIRFGFPESLIQKWKQEQGETLFPLQVKALKEYGLLEGENLLICGPTASGKTFVGELAAVHQALQGKKTVYLVPLKALAKEKYRSFCNRYADYGIRVTLSTRDHRHSDAAILRGEFELAVLVYEKMLRLLAQSPRLVDDIRLVVVDELQMVGDPARGSDLEILLTCLKSTRPGRQVLALSAVIPNSEDFSRWLNARCLSHEERQVELRQGVLYKDRFEYRVASKYQYGEEEIASPPSTEIEEILVANLKELVAREEPCLIFTQSRETSRRLARKLAESLEIRGKVYSGLNDLPPTRSRKLLTECISHGVAFHNADLTESEREVVEGSFRDGRVRVLVATSTLAMGLNLPAANVFIDPEKWNYDPRWDVTWKESISRADFANMGGRAGRPESSVPFGRAIFLVDTEYGRDTLWKRYVEADPEPVKSALWSPGIENALLSALAVSNSYSHAGVESFLDETLASIQACDSQEFVASSDECIDAATRRLQETGLVENGSNGPRRLTALGEVVAVTGIKVETADAIRDFLESSVAPGVPEFDSAAKQIRFLARVCSTPDGNCFLFPMGRIEWDPMEELETKYGVGRERIAEWGANPSRRRGRAPSEYRVARACLLLMDWRSGLSIPELEEKHQVYLGSVVTAAHQAAWLISAVGRLAEVILSAPHHEEWIRWADLLAEEMECGLPYSTRALRNLMSHGFTRDDVMILLRAGIDNRESLTQIKPELLADSLSPSGLKSLERYRMDSIRKAGSSEVTESMKLDSEEGDYELELDSRRPLTVIFRGQIVRLREKEFRLLQILAENAGECVSYDAIYDRLWGDVVVEPGQINHHKAKLLKKLGDIPSGVAVIETIPRHGFRLLLDPEHVIFRAPKLEPSNV